MTSGTARRGEAPCRACLGRDTYEDRLISYTLTLRDRVIIFENVPASVCSQCGETLFTGETAKLIDELARGDSPPTRTAKVPVYDLGEVA